MVALVQVHREMSEPARAVKYSSLCIWCACGHDGGKTGAFTVPIRSSREARLSRLCLWRHDLGRVRAML